MKFIVAEVSKTWVDGEPANGDPQPLSKLFETVVQTNHERGYRLMTFQVVHTPVRRWAPDRRGPPELELNETLIAVFERVAP